MEIVNENLLEMGMKMLKKNVKKKKKNRISGKFCFVMPVGFVDLFFKIILGILFSPELTINTRLFERAKNFASL